MSAWYACAVRIPLPYREKEAFVGICLDAWKQVMDAAPTWALKGRKIMYVTTAVQARCLAQYFTEYGHPAVAFCTKGLSPEERQRNKERWESGGIEGASSAPIIIATSERPA